MNNNIFNNLYFVSIMFLFVSIIIVWILFKLIKSNFIKDQQITSFRIRIEKQQEEIVDIQQELKRAYSNLHNTEAFLLKKIEELEAKEQDFMRRNQELVITEEELRQSIEESKTIQEAMEKQRKELLTANKKLLDGEQILKKGILKLREKEAEVSRKNEELSIFNEELRQSQEEILVQRDLLKSKNYLLEQYTHRLDKSIASAKMIQKAILPPKNKMSQLFEEHFVIFRPRDVVSGDFWWANEIEGKKYLIVADCTGHGVPGAMLATLGSALLDRIIRLSGIKEPSQILEKLHQEIKDVLQQEHTQRKEGMDIAITHWHYTEEHCILSFSGAKRPLYYACGGKIEKVASTRRHIGGKNDKEKFFEAHTLVLPKGTCIYLCSDGYADQNDEEMLSFSERRLLELLAAIQEASMEEQKQILKNELERHMGTTDQRDDILIIGVRL